MIKDLIKLANELDRVGLHEHSDKIDRKIRQLSKEAGVMDPTPSSNWMELAGDVARQVIPLPASSVESVYDVIQGKGAYESLMPHAWRSVEDYMGRKNSILASANASLNADKTAVQAESAKLNASAITAKIKEKVEALDAFLGGSWTLSNYYRNIEAVAPEVLKLSYALGYKGEAEPTKASVGLSSVLDNLSSRTTSYVERDYREAGRWILWQVILDGYNQGVAEKPSAAAPAPPTSTTPSPAPAPGSTPTPLIVGIPLTPLIHRIGTTLSGKDAGGWFYKVTGLHSFDWRDPAGKTGTFTGKVYAPKPWNDAAAVINGLTPDPVSDGGTTTSPPVVSPAPPTSTPQPSNTKNNVEIILSRTAAGAVFSLGTLQNEMARLRRLIEGGMSIPEIAEEVVKQHGTALQGLPLTTDKTEDVNRMSNSEMRKKYKTEIDSIMNTINRVYKSKK